MNRNGNNKKKMNIGHRHDNAFFVSNIVKSCGDNDALYYNQFKVIKSICDEATEQNCH